MVLFVVVTLIQLLYWWLVFARLAFHRAHVPDGQNTEEPVSVVICARNEATNLRRHLPRILSQKDRSLNVTVVNDHSSDETSNVLADFRQRHPTLATVELTTPTAAGKKTALAAGIRASEHDLLLLTDADCAPATPQWAARMTQHFADERTEIVLGYGPYYRLPGWLNRFVRFETVWTAVQYLSFALVGLPYMGVGRNLAYRKRLFARADGFAKHDDLPSGDDDLFINAVARGGNVRVELSPESVVHSDPKTTWRSWLRQKSRHLTTGTRYRFIHQILLGSYTVTHLLHFAAAAWLLTNGHFALVGWGVGIRWLSLWFIGALVCRRLRESDLIPFLPLFDLALLAYYFFMGTIPFRQRKNW